MLYVCSIQPLYFSTCFSTALFCAALKTENHLKEKQMNNTQTPTRRPQEPIAPFPYNTQEVSYRNDTADVTLAGTLTTPKGKGTFPAVILIAGMGAVGRDGAMYGHKLYLVLADYLTRQGIAVLRFDKRGVGSSTGSFGPHITSRDLADDVLAGITYLKTRRDIDPKHIGLVGTSEGGFIASLIAAESKDVAFVVSMAGAITNSPTLLAKQIAIQLHADGASNELCSAMKTLTEQILTTVCNEPNAEKAEQILSGTVTTFLDEQPDTLRIEAAKYPFAISPANIAGKINVYNSPWYRWLLAQDITGILSSIHVPYLALYGERDFMAPNMMIPIIEQAMQYAHNPDYAVLELPSLNHAFQTCKTGALTEYATIDETISPEALITIGNWIKAHTH